MGEKRKKICILGGAYFVLSYIFNQTEHLFRSQNMPQMVSCAEIISIFLFLTFVILFFSCLFKPQKLVFLKRIMEKQPKTSVYIYYIGFIGYILFVFDILIITPFLFISVNEIVQKYVALGIAGVNIGGIVLSLIIASRKIFAEHKTIETI